jgi:hypothetical protein
LHTGDAVHPPRAAISSGGGGMELGPRSDDSDDEDPTRGP